MRTSARTRISATSVVTPRSPAFRSVFVLRSVEDMSPADTAAALGIPEDTVKTRLFRARGLLQKSLSLRLEATSRDAFSFERPRCDIVVGAVLARSTRIT